MEITDSHANDPELGDTKLGTEVTRRTGRIHDLPVELLANIFLATKCYKSCSHRSHQHSATRKTPLYPMTLASVCRSWHYVSLSLPWLWSHIDLVTKWVDVSPAHSDYVQLMNQRSSGATVDLCIWVDRDITHDLSRQRVNTLTEKTLVGLTSVLAPLMPRTYRLKIASDIYPGSELQPILAFMAKLRSGGLLEAFTVHAANDPLKSARIFSWANSNSTDQPTAHQLDNFFKPIRVLNLQESTIPWDSCVYQGLTELLIGLTSVFDMMSCDQLARILLACPALCLLSLKNVHATCSHNDPTRHGPIYLEQLQRLELFTPHSHRLTPILQILRPQSQRLDVVITTSSQPGFIEELRTFFHETPTVMTLHVRPNYKTAWFAPLYKSLHRLLRLSLWGCDFADPDLAIFVRTEHYNHGTVPWPWLYELRLFDCIIELELLECFANSPFLGRLKLFDCRVRGSDPGKLVPVVMSMFEPVFGGPHVEVLIYDDILAYQ